MGHVEVGHRWKRVTMDLLDMSVTTARGNRYVLVMVDCFSGGQRHAHCLIRLHTRWPMRFSTR